MARSRARVKNKVAKSAKAKTKTKVVSDEPTFSFLDLQKELKKIAPLGSTMDVNEFSEISDYISSGSYILNACMTGSIRKGYPNNRSVSLNGPSGVGKTFLMLNSAKRFQDKGYIIVWYDSENAVDNELMIKFGLDTTRVWYEPTGTVEAFRTSATNLTQRLIDAQRKGLTIPKLAIYLDSAGNLPSEKEVRDAESGANKADMTRAKMFKSIFRILMNKFAEIKAPFIFSNHTYQTQEMFSQMKAGGGTGPEYSASIILYMTKAKLSEKSKDDKGKKVTKQIGNIITVKPNKNRFAKPHQVKIHLRYDKGMNDYVGLEEYLDWDTVGIGKGIIMPGLEYDKLKGDKKKKSKEYTTADGEIFHYIPDEKSSTIAIKHLNTQVKSNEFYTPEVFTEEVLDLIDENVKPLFNYGMDEEMPEDDLFVMEDAESEEEEEVEED